MLTHDEARERMEGYKVRGWRNAALARIKELPDPLHAIAEELLGRDAVPDPGLWARNRLRPCCLQAETLEHLPSEQRQLLFGAFLPQIGQHVEALWQFWKTQPCIRAAGCMAFRLPHSPHLSLPNRYGSLRMLIEHLGPHPQDITWFADWGSHSAWATGQLLAAVLSEDTAESEAVFGILREQAAGRHEVGFGLHVPRALLQSSRPDGWQLVEDLLLGAEREEGLRQNLLESIHLAHPGAFRHILRVILDHDLVRFSSVARALDVWINYRYDSCSAKLVQRDIGQLLQLLEQPEARHQAWAGEDPDAAYLALLVTAWEDAEQVIHPAAKMLHDRSPDKRFAAACVLLSQGLPAGCQAALLALEDEDPCVRGLLAMMIGYGACDHADRGDLFERLERFLERLPARPHKWQPASWPWVTVKACRQDVADAMVYLRGQRPASRLVPYLPAMSPQGRHSLISLFRSVRAHRKQLQWDAEARDLVLPLLGDASPAVQDEAFEYAAQCDLPTRDIQAVEGLLGRKAAGLRRRAVGLLLRRADDDVLASAGRLLEASSQLQRLAGLEVLRQMVEAARTVDACRQVAARYRATRTEAGLTSEERSQLEAIGSVSAKAASLDDALGLIDVAALTQSPPAREGVAVRKTPGATALLRSLDDVVHEHRETLIAIDSGEGVRQEMLGNAGMQFPRPDPDLPLDQILPNLPLAAVWQDWWQQRDVLTRDPDGMELLRAGSYSLRRDAKLRYESVVGALVEWFLQMHPLPGAVDFLLDALETAIAQGHSVRQRLLAALESRDLDMARDGMGDMWTLDIWAHRGRDHQQAFDDRWTTAHYVRLWHLVNPLQGALCGEPGVSALLAVLLRARREGAANDADLIARILRPTSLGLHPQFAYLSELSRLRPHPLCRQYPDLQSVVDRCRRRILEVELQRGETPTAATDPALALRYAGGMDVLLRLLAALGRESFARDWQYDRQSKAGVFSYLVRCTVPGAADTPQAFATTVKDAGLPKARLLELAAYAPLWASRVEHAMQWPGLADAIWWLHAHTKDDKWQVDPEIRDLWASEVSQRTPLAPQDLLEGAVDVAWFQRVYAQLREQRWRHLDEVAPLASTAGGHKRAQLFADAMRGRLHAADLLDRVRAKRHLDAVRTLGLLPLPTGRACNRDLLERYQALQAFLRQSRQFGAQRQASERRAFEIGMQNLARTAGYADPLRLEWAMEAEALADLAAGPVTITVGQGQASLSLDDQGQPDITFRRGGKPLRAAPAALKKDTGFKALQERRTQLRRQASRTRASLEGSMCRGDVFTGRELLDLCRHPILAPMLERLVIVGEGIMGYPVDGGRGLQHHAGRVEPVRAGESLRIAHPLDLQATKEWHLWQRDCFARERVQPFKQVFRELYVPTEAELQDGGCASRRYAGQQVHPNRAVALLGARQWVVRPDEGVHRTCHSEGITAWLGFLEAWFTPAEVEGLTVETVQFFRRGEHAPVPLAQVPPRVFSEVMRDLDLVVSVAHRSGVDPEASASTRDMRAALVRETCQLLDLHNVRVQTPHVLVDGQLAHYSVHLGSGVAHRMPGGMLWIVPVHSQHRGRLFLPFADDDPRTAEIISKVILLARDQDIKDPGILRQIRGQ